MFSLIEKVLERQIEALMKADSSKSSDTTTSVANTDLSDGATVGNSSDPSVPSGRPVGGVLTQGYTSTHNGLDFGIPIGTKVHSSMDGKVAYAGWNNEGYGNLVIVENGAYKTYYAHLSEIPVSVGDEVSAGDVIGLSGSTGNSTGPHLHYEIRKNGVNINPTSTTLGN
jgi:murein DD-endopeptidase MepM/ murein hydrolase activator NlpD